MTETLRRAGFELLRALLHTFHVGLLAFTLVGWISCHTRAAHLAFIAAILASWFGLGWFRGFGYCLITDWQWRLMAHLGESKPAGGYVKYLLDRATGASFDNGSVDRLTSGAFAGAAAAALATTWLYGFC